MELLTASIIANPLSSIVGIGAILSLLLGVVLSTKVFMTQHVSGASEGYEPSRREQVAYITLFILWIAFGVSFVIINQTHADSYKTFLSGAYEDQHGVEGLVPIAGAITACTSDSRADRMPYSWRDKAGESYSGMLSKTEESAGTCLYTLTA